MEHIELKAQIGECQLRLEALQAQINVEIEKKQKLTAALYQEMNKPKAEKKEVKSK